MKKLILMAALMMTLPMSAHAANVADERASVQNMAHSVLNRLYSVKPDTQREIHDAAGFAVFSSGSLALIWVSGGYGHGIAHDNASGNDTYMEQANAGVGLGIGVKDYSTVFVFHDAKSYHDFVTTGLDLSGHADAAAKQGIKGGSYSGAADVLPGVRVYQLTNNGLIAQAMLQGTKYWQDNDLNANDGAAPLPSDNNNKPKDGYQGHYND